MSATRHLQQLERQFDAMARGVARFAEACRAAATSWADALNTPEWQRIIAKERRRERYVRRYERGRR